MHTLIFTYINVYFVAATLSFNQSTYNVTESSGITLITLILSNPSSSDITLQINNRDGSATGKNTLYDSITLC